MRPVGGLVSGVGVRVGGALVVPGVVEGLLDGLRGRPGRPSRTRLWTSSEPAWLPAPRYSLPHREQ
ncbi:hypothetical protein ACFV0O_27230, partial [Kitasatospora sp. NPDC059577]|uniref:hypothetical protein n=1 Tax=Kitasatospora sp. NPDC059577 TaxID=3346873 RepID=UPI0036D0BE6E